MVTHTREILSHHVAGRQKNLCYADFVKESSKIFQEQKTQNIGDFFSGSARTNGCTIAKHKG